MNIKYTTTTLKKIEQLFEETCYRVRYEKGQFHSGYCVLEEKKIAVINKFLDTEGRINALLDIIPTIQIRYDELSGEMQQFYKQIQIVELNKGLEKQAEIDFGTTK